jgi:hypothetical protein
MTPINHHRKYSTTGYGNNTHGTLIACFVNISQEVTFRIALVLTTGVPKVAIE